MNVMLSAGRLDTHANLPAVTWTGEVPWPGVPHVGAAIRPAYWPKDAAPLRVADVVFEPDPTVYLVLEPVDAGVQERLVAECAWTEI